MDESRSLREQVEKLCRASSRLVRESSRLLEQVALTIRQAHQFLSNGAAIDSCPPRSQEARNVRV